MLFLLIVVVVIVGVSPRYLGVDWGAVLQVCGTLFGVVIGGYLSGMYATEIVKTEIAYNKEVKHKADAEINEKNSIIINGQLTQLRTLIKGIRFLSDFFHEDISSLYQYEDDPYETMVKDIKEAEESVKLLMALDPHFVTKDNLQLIYHLYIKINEIKTSSQGYLYDIDHTSIHIDNIARLCDYIVDLINSSTSKLEDTK